MTNYTPNAHEREPLPLPPYRTESSLEAYQELHKLRMEVKRIRKLLERVFTIGISSSPYDFPRAFDLDPYFFQCLGSKKRRHT